MDFNPNLGPKQIATLNLAPTARIAIWEGAVRSSKTVVSLIAWADFVQHAPPGPLLMAARTTDTLRRNAVDVLLELFGPAQIKPVHGAGIAVMFGRTVHLVGADNAAAETRIRGLTLAGAYVDELTIVGGPAGKSWFEMLLTRLSIPGARLYATTNPGSPQHWLLEDFLSKAEIEVTRDGRIVRYTDAPAGMHLHRYRFVLDDNPTLSSEYVTGLKASLSGLFFRRFIEGEWVAAEGAVFPMLDTIGEAHHLTQVAPPLTPLTTVNQLTVALDVGTSNPTHAVALLADIENQRMVVISELRLTGDGRTDVSQATDIGNWITRELIGVHVPATTQLADIKIVIDPAAKSLRNAWTALTGSYSKAADNSVSTGINNISTLLGSTPPRLMFVTGQTPHLLRELSGYTWDEKAKERGEDKPVKRDDHGVDALRYAVMGSRKTWRPWITNPDLMRQEPVWVAPWLR